MHVSMLSTFRNNYTKKLIQLSLPMVLTHIITMGSGFLCMTMLAKLGHKALAASALIFSIQMAVIHISASLLFSLSLLIGHRFGKKDYGTIGALVQQGWLLSLIISIPIFLIYWHIYTILIFLGQDRTISKIVEEFFHANIWVILPFFFAVCNQQLCYGVQKQKIDMYANALSVVVLLISAYIFIFGKFGLPPLGVAGFGYASALQGWFYFLSTSSCLCVIHDFKKFNLFRICIYQNWHTLIDLFKIGWPISLQVSGEMLSFVVSAVFIGCLGTTALAAYQVIMQYQYLIVIPIFAISQASAILMRQTFGSKQYSDINELVRTSVRIVVAISTTIGLTFILFPKILSSLYLNIHDTVNIQTMHLVITLFMILSVSQFFDAIRNALMGFLRGLLDTKYVMAIGFISSWFIGIPLGYLFAFFFHGGAPGIFLGGMCGILFGTGMLYFRWQLKLPKNISLPLHSKQARHINANESS
ncbi:MAG: MATE family efflux transporter [Cellulomonas sp.]|nr:MATE family efflux transporter [Rickettsiella sp.]